MNAKMVDYMKIIEQDENMAEEYFVSGQRDGTNFAKAAEIVESDLSELAKCLLDARRELEKHRKYKSRRHWVIKTQFIYNRLAEERGIKVTWLSESKIKREWRHYVKTVEEIAVRLK